VSLTTPPPLPSPTAPPPTPPLPSKPSVELSLSVLLILYYRHSPERPDLLSGEECSQGKLDEYNIL